MTMPGPRNAITDVPGLKVGHHTNAPHASGVSVVLCPEGTAAGVDVRGSAPGTRETDLLAPVNLVEHVGAVALCGGSVYGLAAVDGVVRWLEAEGRGFPIPGVGVAPIVPAAALFDLGRGETPTPPTDASWGRMACEAAREDVPQGSVGAGTGALAGGIKGGIGTASAVLPNGCTVGALVAVNSLGAVIDPATGLPWELRLELAGEFGPAGRRAVTPPAPQQAAPCISWSRSLPIWCMSAPTERKAAALATAWARAK